METKQTAIEWLKEEMKICRTEEDKRIVFRIARIMEKEQIEKAYESGCIGEVFELNCNHSSEQYYNETYGK